MLKARRKYKFEPDYAVAPGETLRELIESIGMTQAELARRTGLTTVSIARILSGDQPISYETANRLELVTGVQAEFWNRLEANYREQLLKQETLLEQERQMAWLKTVPTKELICRGYISEEANKSSLLQEVLSFYGVASVDAYRKVWKAPPVAARRSKCFESRPGPASAWLRIGEIEAARIQCQPFNKKKFQEALSVIRGLTTEPPEVFLPEMKRVCAESGVALVLVKEMKQVPWNGATKWLSPEKAMILLSLRGKGEDKFWFSLFHEAGHILHDGKRSILINDGSTTSALEIKANEFAAEYLIPQKQYDPVIRKAKTRSDIEAIAEELGIAPGIVAGRYQFLTSRWSYFADMIRRFQWVEDDAS